MSWPDELTGILRKLPGGGARKKWVAFDFHFDVSPHLAGAGAAGTRYQLAGVVEHSGTMRSGALAAPHCPPFFPARLRTGFGAPPRVLAL